MAPGASVADVIARAQGDPRAVGAAVDGDETGCAAGLGDGERQVGGGRGEGRAAQGRLLDDGCLVQLARDVGVVDEQSGVFRRRPSPATVAPDAPGAVEAEGTRVSDRDRRRPVTEGCDDRRGRRPGGRPEHAGAGTADVERAREVGVDRLARSDGGLSATGSGSVSGAGVAKFAGSM